MIAAERRATIGRRPMAFGRPAPASREGLS